MTNAQIYLNQNYPKEQRGEIVELDICRKELEGHLDLSDFVNLEKLDCQFNQLASLEISNCKKLEEIYCAANEIKQDLAIFSHLKNLRILDLGYINPRSLILQTNHPELTVKVEVIFGEEWNNQFCGSLKSLAKCQNLEWVFIACQKDITGSLADLPTEKLTHFGCNFTSFTEQLKLLDYDVAAWQLLNVPEKFDRQRIREKIEEARQRKTQLLQEKDARRVQQIYRLKKKISFLTQKISEKPPLPATRFLSVAERAQAEAIIARIRAIDSHGKGKKAAGKALMEVYQYDCLALDCDRKVPNFNQYCWEHYFSGNPEEEELIGITEEQIEKVKRLIHEKWDELAKLEQQASKLTKEVSEELAEINKREAQGETVDPTEREKIKQKLNFSKEIIARTDKLKKAIILAIYESNSEESETENLENSKEVRDNSSEISHREETDETHLQTEDLAEQETTEENPRTDEAEPEQPSEERTLTPQELAIAQVEKYWTDNADNQGLINGKNITDTLSINWKEKIANCSDPANLIPQASELIGKIAYQANQTSEEKSAEISNWKKFLIGGGTLLAGGTALTGLAGWIGYVKLHALASVGAVKSATGFATVIKAGKSAAIIKKTAMAGLTWLKDFIPVGYTEIGPWLGTTFKWLITSPWFWVPALIIAAIVAFCYRDKIWQGIKKVFNFANQTKKKFTNFFKKPFARFFRSETPAEKEAREKKEELEQKEAEVAEVREQITQTAEQRKQLASERERISAEEFARKNAELETKLNELTTKLEQLEQEKEKTNEEYQAIPEDIRQASETKEEQLLKNVETGLEISFWVGVIFIFALVWKLIQKFFSLVFGRPKKDHGKELAEVKESLNQLTELEKQKIEREIEREKLATAKLNAEQERVSQKKLLEQAKEQLTKQKDQQNPPAKKKKRRKKASSSLTYYHRHRKEINAKRRANYRLRKEKKNV